MSGSVLMAQQLMHLSLAFLSWVRLLEYAIV